ncbi:hypothetical protein YH65_07590 [Sulfurovum lithotrophicum]|uniref:Glycosyltransferase 2-like domain-containing protein n=1 Tax=Sulfurovum lithotrophicum TaxID=206403 RepID=A0A7U4RQZ9_9BACT|nr:glycosyltransferase family 2 protein [Sulfurovum lithotrophicum]AKF25267.1 hypothetical protein YH65_07590 [Sulfurovum lithotrophicum]
MHNTPFLSVIIPTFTIEKHIEQCLDSVVHQTFHNMEIIIIDDASRDSTPEIIRKYAKRDSRIKPIFHEKNIGPGATRNEGLNLATGRYVTLMDHDDWQDLTKYEKMVQKAQTSNADIVFCNAVEYNETTHETFTLYDPPSMLWRPKPMNFDSLEEKLHSYGQFIPPWTKIVKRDMVKHYDIRFSEREYNKFDDVLFHYLSLLFAKRIEYIDEALYTHRFFPESISAQAETNTDVYFDSFKTWDDLADNCRKNAIEPETVFIYYVKELSSPMYVVENSKMYAKMAQNIIANMKLKKTDFPKKYRKYYHRIMNYSSLKKAHISLRRFRKRIFSQ